ncbi:MAG: TonB-dependent receptor plug domain-containing protein, partial [Cruoricaptor ignavus]|nr:TonB-dependent receptor plug domain-containing protein [Cruoricaptor ignavus]
MGNIEEVVVTGQFSPQSIKKSLYKVEVISEADIQKMAVNNVAEVLNQSLNIMIIPDKNSGDSKANILGLGANYTKILVDNIPLVGDTGLGSNIDLTKINLENIERIEIVKGSMGVEFGNNAMVGVINIITKKNTQKKWNFRGSVQEETVGKEYNWIDYGKGRHIQNFGVSHNFSEKWFADFSFNRNDFQGFWNEKQGKNYFVQDNKRGYEWQPKEQINPAFLLRFRNSKTQFFYKANYLLEKINYYNPLVQPQNLGGGERTYISTDRDYFTDRMLHHFNIRTVLFEKSDFSADISYQKQKRQNQDYVFDIPERQEAFRYPKNTYYESKTIYSRATLSNFISSEKMDVQVGYEGDFTEGFSGWATASFGGNNILKKVLNAGVFAVTELHLNDQWFLRSGLRFNFSDTFKTQPNFSLVLKNKINDYSEFRAIVGSSNRNPNFEELFTYFVDANHDIRGNENLQPEKSYSGTLFYSLSSKPEQLWKWNLDASTMYLQVRDKIEVATVNPSPLKFLYMNVDGFQSWINALSGRLSYRDFGFSAGVSLLGKSWE